jgi:hypothetical protein
LICVALAAFALVGALTGGDPTGGQAAALFTVVAIVFFARYRAAVDHNAALTR